MFGHRCLEPADDIMNILGFDHGHDPIDCKIRRLDWRKTRERVDVVGGGCVFFCFEYRPRIATRSVFSMHMLPGV